MKRRAQEEYQAVYDGIKKKQTQYKVMRPHVCVSQFGAPGTLTLGRPSLPERPDWWGRCSNPHTLNPAGWLRLGDLGHRQGPE